MFTNEHNIDLPLAVWLASNDGYDLQYDPNLLSATDLLKPIRSLILSRQLMAKHPKGIIEQDISNIVASRMGHAIHEAIERSWLNNYEQAMKILGYPQHVIDRVEINPSRVEPKSNIFPVYLEQRSARNLGAFTVSGKFDIVVDGQLSDFKSTSTFAYMKGANDVRFARQGSIYRWLNPDIITSDVMTIQYIFTDWSAVRAATDNDYPSLRVQTKQLPLLTLDQTEAYIRDVLEKVEYFIGASQSELPRCNRVELWQDPPKFALYKDPNNQKRATKLFDNENDAFRHNVEKFNGQGIVVKRESTPTYCNYCAAQSICMQAQEYIDSGLLK